MGVGRRLPVRSKVTVGLFARAGSEFNETVLDDHKPLALRGIHGPEEIGRSEAADLGGELDIELVTEHGQRSHQARCGARASIHPSTVAPSTRLGSPPDGIAPLLGHGSLKR